MSAITIDIASTLNLDKIEQRVKDVINDELNNFGLQTVSSAKRYAPVDEGFLRNSISFQKNDLNVEIVVAANYAAFVEFGTRKFAASHVGSLPAEWQAFAAQFKGRKAGNFKQFVDRLMEWVHRKGLGKARPGKKPIGVTGTYSIKTRKRTGSKSTQENEDRQAAYAIARSIMIKGSPAQAFLVPAVEENKIKLINNLKRALNAR